MSRLKVLGAIALLSLTTLVPPSLAAAKKPVAHAKRPHAKLPPGILFDCRLVKGNWKLNGLYGPFTRDAVQAFQRTQHLFPDGVAGLKTDRALGLTFTRKLRCGMGGHDVYLLQKALLAHGYWNGQHGHPSPTPTPTPVPSPPLAPSPSVPSSGWQQPPILYTPAPIPTPEPSVPTPTSRPSATPRPLVLAPPSPTPRPVATAATPPVATVALGLWVPVVGPGTSATIPFGLDAQVNALIGPVDLHIDAMDVSSPGGRPNPNPPTPDVRSYGPPLVDVDLGSHLGPSSEAYIGYRGFPLGGIQYGILGLSVDHALGAPWAAIHANIDAGLGAEGAAQTYNGQVALRLSAGNVLFTLGYRHLIFVTSQESFALSGPIAQIGIGL